MLPLSTLASCLLSYLSSEVRMMGIDVVLWTNVDIPIQNPNQASRYVCLLSGPKVEKGSDSTLVYLLCEVQSSLS